jgi:hypothetical protein
MMLQPDLTDGQKEEIGLKRGILLLQEGFIKEKLKTFKNHGQENVQRRDEVCTRHSP